MEQLEGVSQFLNYLFLMSGSLSLPLMWPYPINVAQLAPLDVDQLHHV